MCVTGYTAGTNYDETGGSAEYTCLPRNPQWKKYMAGDQFGGDLYGTEFEVGQYEDRGYYLLSRANNNGLSLHDENVPCVLCVVHGKAITRTFPAMTECPAAWQKEYQGYFMAENLNHQGRMMPVCVDEAPETIPGGRGNTNGALLYYTEARCGALPCPPYVDDREITCVVCSF